MRTKLSYFFLPAKLVPSCIAGRLCDQTEMMIRPKERRKEVQDLPKGEEEEDSSSKSASLLSDLLANLSSPVKDPSNPFSYLEANSKAILQNFKSTFRIAKSVKGSSNPLLATALIKGNVSTKAFLAKLTLAERKGGEESGKNEYRILCQTAPCDPFEETMPGHILMLPENLMESMKLSVGCRVHLRSCEVKEFDSDSRLTILHGSSQEVCIS